MDDPASVLADPSTFEPVDDGLSTRDPLDWDGYADALAVAARRADESLVAGAARIGGIEVELALFDFSFMGGSMGEVAGERLARALERAARRGVAVVLRTSTGGARMQEGMVSLAQMPKVVAARLMLADAHRPLIAVLGDPTTGGVLASVAALADLTIAEAGATVAFAGPRVSELFAGRPSESDPPTAERALGCGLVDEVVSREEVASRVAAALGVLRPDEPTSSTAPSGTIDAPTDGWDAVTTARADDRPTGRALIDILTDEAVELRGDRAGRDDPAVRVALARVLGRRAALIALDREHPPRASGYRKARRGLAVAERLRLPVVTLIDTPGADPSPESEGQGVAWAIADTFAAMLSVAVPVVAVVAGEGGSGGALALACGNALVACAGSTFSVIGPEAAAAILWRDPARAPEAARRLKLGAPDLVELGIADALAPTPLEPDAFRAAIAHHLAAVCHAAAAENPAAARRRRWRGA